MARLDVNGNQLVLQLTIGEKIGAMHGDIRVPTSSVRQVRAVAQGRSEIRGIRAPGTGIPGVVFLGTLRGSFGKDFGILYGNRPAVVVELDGEEFQRLLVSDADAPATAQRISEAVQRAQ